METFSVLLAICAGNSPVTGEFPTKRPVARSFDVYFDLRPNKRLSKPSWGWWFETPSWSLWRQCNDVGQIRHLIQDLTHLPLVPHRCVSEVGQHCRLFGAKPLPESPNQCWLIVYWTIRNKLQWHLNQNTKRFIPENTFKNAGGGGGGGGGANLRPLRPPRPFMCFTIVHRCIIYPVYGVLLIYYIFNATSYKTFLWVRDEFSLNPPPPPPPPPIHTHTPPSISKITRIITILMAKGPLHTIVCGTFSSISGKTP